MNESINGTMNQTVTGITNIITDKISETFSFIWSISQWVANTLFSLLPESTRLLISIGFTIVPFAIFILLIWGSIKAFSKFFGFTAKWIVPILFVIFFMIIIFAFLGIGGNQQPPPPIPIG